MRRKKKGDASTYSHTVVDELLAFLHDGLADGEIVEGTLFVIVCDGVEVEYVFEAHVEGDSE